MQKSRINPEDRLGILNTNKYGSEMKVVEYNNPIDIFVKFISTSEEPVHTTWNHFSNGAVRSRFDRTVHGVGFIGTGKYIVSKNRNYTPQYISWNRMIQRCYHEKHLIKYPTYRGCVVAEEWHNFQNFAKWYDENYYEIEGQRMDLDKDILIKGNKIYSPETCVFVPQKINKLFLKCDARRGNLPIGVYQPINSNKFAAKYTNKIYLGVFDTKEEAFNIYKLHKESYIREIANEYKDKLPNKLYDAMLRYEIDILD